MAIKNNQMVSMNYELKINDEITDSILNEEPIEFKFGTGEIIPGLEKRISKMNINDEKVIKVPAIEAYGEYDENLTETLPIKDFGDINLEIGMVLEGENDKGELLKATVIEVTNKEVTVDYNHPLAGCNLEFKVIIKNIS